jgi:putative ABC transport system substrate-binding protein
MNRRCFIAVMAGAMVPALVYAQPVAPIRRIAILDPGDRALRAEQWQVLESRLRELGYVEGRNLKIDRRWADGVDARLPHLAQELLAGKPEVVLVTTTPATQALMRLTDKIAIVMTGTADPVATGLVASLSRPGGNVTGVSVQLDDVAKKRLDLMREILPKAKRFGVLGSAANAGTQSVLRQLQSAARERGLDVRILEAADPQGIARAFDSLAAESIDAVLVTQVMNQHKSQIVELAARYRIPASYVDMEFLDAGGLLAFGPVRDGPYRHAAEYVYRILQGANPAEMPVMQPTEFWLGINLRTAQALGLKIPQSVLIRANRVIE